MGERALVLGGGGVTGVAWELGLLAGLADAGLGLGGADVVIGTSAGSVVGAQLTSDTPLETLYQRQLAPPDGEIATVIGKRTVLTMAGSALVSPDVRTARRRIGRMALGADTGPEAERRKVIESRLNSHEWPRERRLLVTAVDAHTGEFTAFHSGSGAPLVDAVAASCAVPGVWPCVTIDGRRWMDGGVRSSANADLAHGFRRVVVLAPMALHSPLMPGPRQQADRLRRDGAHVAVITPDAFARQAIGRNVLDPARRADAARAGREQAPSVAPLVNDVWQGARS
ncbi:patatin-like phospholipase family protein [Streptomyces silvisoli]|uniref:Patatin-like phospholipase family protein n=1 Tax=Streptomyces silvisoli TaxID=3034235 RepID=A0ABT5ZCZ0_9ACTN|nr:patatin-like phospholipase family protein [Streptomyces silvisoli]MDF3287704.1 patatin-like phospholipase family protein [Streptomyces silvisoli]